MARPKSPPDLHLLTKVATLYYLEDETQQAIADRLHLSRPTVTRMLQDAKARGVVRITIAAPDGGRHAGLESQLESLFGLREAHVVDIDRRGSPESMRREIGTVGARVLARTVRPNETIGLAWGTTLSAMVQAMTPLPTTGVRIVQTLGGVGPPDAESYAADLVRRLADGLGAAPVLLPAPGIVASPAVRDSLSGDPHVRAALRLIDSLDTVYVGIGSLKSNPFLTDTRVVQAPARAELRAAGAVGDIALRYFDAEGRALRTSLDNRILGMTLAQLRRVPRVVALAGGANKVDAIRAALRANLIHVLVTDHLTAAALVERTTRVAGRAAKM